jgi:hypothetical protein
VTGRADFVGKLIGHRVSEPFEAAPMNLGDRSISYAVEGTDFRVTTDPAGTCTSHVDRFRFTHGGELVEGSDLIDTPGQRVVQLVFRSSLWIALSRPCFDGDQWYVSFISRDGVDGTYELIFDEENTRGRRVFIPSEGPSVSFYALYTSTHSDLRSQTFDVMDGTTEEPVTVLELDPDSEIGLPYWADITHEIGQGFALLVSELTIGDFQKTWFIRYTYGGAVVQSEVISEGTSQPPAYWVGWLGDGFGLYWNDGSSNVLGKWICDDGRS